MAVADIYGPNTAQVIAFIEASRALTLAQWQSCDTSSRESWDEARCDAWDSAIAALQAAPAYDDSMYDARKAAMVDAWDAAYEAYKARLAEGHAVTHRNGWPIAGDAGYNAQWVACALVFRDHVPPTHFAILTASMRSSGITFGEETR